MQLHATTCFPMQPHITPYNPSGWGTQAGATPPHHPVPRRDLWRPLKRVHRFGIMFRHVLTFITNDPIRFGMEPSRGQAVIVSGRDKTSQFQRGLVSKTTAAITLNYPLRSVFNRDKTKYTHAWMNRCPAQQHPANILKTRTCIADKTYGCIYMYDMCVGLLG